MKTTTSYLLLFCLCIPFAALAQWTQTNGPEGGYVTCVEKINNEIWAGTKGGLYFSTDEGLNWQRKPGFDQIITDVSFKDNVITIAYQGHLGNGSDDLYGYSQTSYDGGINWTSPSSMFSVYSCFYWKITPLQTATLAYDGTGGSGLLISYDYGEHWSAFPVPFALSMGNMANDGKTFVAWRFNHQYTASAVYTSGDNGLNWSLIDSSSFVRGAYVKDSLLILNRSDSHNNLWFCRSTDSGNTWDTVFTATQGEFYYDLIKIGNKIYAMGSATRVSIDNGLTWQLSAMPKDWFADQVTISNGDLLVTSPYADVAKYSYSDDSLYIRHKGIAARYVYALRAHNNILYASTDDGFYKSADAGQTWQLAGVPVGGETDIAFAGDTVLGVTANSGYDNYLVRSFNNGNTWDSVPLPAVTVPDFSTLQFYNSRIYLRTAHIYYSDDMGLNWVQMPFPDSVYGNPYPFMEMGTTIKIYRNQLFAVNDGGFVFKYDPGLESWYQLGAFYSPGASHHYELYDLDNALVLAGNRSFRVSYDEGQTWSEPAMDGIPYQNAPHNLILANGMWLGTCGVFGVYASIDSGNTWNPFYTGSSPFATSLRGGLTVMNNTLYAGGDCRSVWQYNGPLQIPTGIKNETLTDGMQVFPNPVHDEFFLRLNNNGSEVYQLTLYNANGVVVTQQQLTGNFVSISTDAFPAGVYIGRLRSDAQTPVKTFRFVRLND
jgi:photosystem II stability/assembly factor-like uncharacterized protein